MQLVSFTVQHYVSIPYEKFTDKIIAALAVFQVIETFDEDDLLEVLWIEENTHPKVMVPVYILDRCINPSKASDFKTMANKVTFDTNIADDNDKTVFKQITLTENQMQYYLCKAIRRIHDIIMKSIKNYSEEIPIPNLGETKNAPELSFDKV